MFRTLIPLVEAGEFLHDLLDGPLLARICRRQVGNTNASLHVEMVSPLPTRRKRSPNLPFASDALTFFLAS